MFHACNRPSMPPGRRACARRSRRRSTLLDDGKLRVAEKGGRTWRVHQWLKKAVLLSFRLNDMVVPIGAGRAGGGAVVGQGAPQIRPAGARAVRQGAASARCLAPWCAAPPTLRPGAVLMPCFVNVGAYVGFRHHDRHLGDGRLVRADRRQLPHLGRRRHRRRARAAAGGAGHHRGRLLRRRPLRGGGGRHRRQGAVLSMGVFIGASTRIVDRATGESMSGACRPIRWWCRALPGGRFKNGAPGPSTLLRRHRQARRREDSRQDLDQRIAARLTAETRP
jgi:2,3,4,5-tetrahydropyridine-2-carboxylate N-succinyltransferase